MYAPLNVSGPYLTMAFHYHPALAGDPSVQPATQAPRLLALERDLPTGVLAARVDELTFVHGRSGRGASEEV